LASEEAILNKDSNYPSDVAFTPTVKAIQSRKGSRRGYAGREQRGSWETLITPDLVEFIGRQISIFVGTASRDGQPYIQHRGGPPIRTTCGTAAHHPGAEVGEVGLPLPDPPEPITVASKPRG
jgi:hypothetical protein